MPLAEARGTSARAAAATEAVARVCRRRAHQSASAATAARAIPETVHYKSQKRLASWGGAGMRESGSNLVRYVPRTRS